MNALLGTAAVVAILSTLAVVVQRKAVHALLYLIVAFFALALSMLALGAAFAAALEVMVYAGAIRQGAPVFRVGFGDRLPEKMDEGDP